MAKAEYRSAKKSRRQIRNAFLDLAQEKKVSSITVTDIVNRADLNRGTFYAHYDNIDALFDEIAKEIIDSLLGFLDTFNVAEFMRNPYPKLLEGTRLIEENREYSKQLIDIEGMDTYKTHMHELFVDRIKSSKGIPKALRERKGFDVFTNFVAGGIAVVYPAWIKGELDYTAEDLAHTLSDMLRGFFANVLTPEDIPS